MLVLTGDVVPGVAKGLKRAAAGAQHCRSGSLRRHGVRAVQLREVVLRSCAVETEAAFVIRI